MNEVQLSVVLPTFNERDNIIPLMQRIASSLAGVRYEILVVDDDSTDQTAALAERYSGTHSEVRVIKRIGVRGLRSAIQEGIDQSAAEAVAWMDCDASMPPELLPQLLAALGSSAIAIGSRYADGGLDGRSNVRLHRFCSRALNRFTRTLLGPVVSDYTSGFVCAKRSALREIRLVGDYGEYCIDLLYHASRRGFAILEVPYHSVPRMHGESKTATSALSLLRRGWAYVMVVVRLRFGSTGRSRIG